MLWCKIVLLVILRDYAHCQTVSPPPPALISFVDRETLPMESPHHRWSALVNNGLTDPNLELEPEFSVLLRLRGSGFKPDTLVGFTTQAAHRGSLCNDSTIWERTFRVSGEGLTGEGAHLRVSFPLSLASAPSILYLCLLHRGIASPSGSTNSAPPTSSLPPLASTLPTSTSRWVHQGEGVKVRLAPALFESLGSEMAISGVRAEGDRVYFFSNGVTSVPANQATSLRLFGQHLDDGRKVLIAFTRSRRSRGSSCDDLATTVVQSVPAKDILGDRVLILTVTLPELEDGEFFYICTKDATGKGSWVHQGDDPWMSIFSEGRLIPKWIQIWLIVLLQVMSGLFSGLNLGLMALDKTELKIISKCGTQREKDYAKIIAPLRSRGNYLLCSIVLGNVLVNSLLTVMLDDLTSGLVAVIGSTVGIVIFGEIIPQAICSRHGLAVGAMTAWITKLFMLLTFPMSYPISKILDCCLGEEIGNVYDREKLMEYVKVIEDYHKLEKEEVNMISGALELKRKTAVEIMTPLEDVYMIPDDAQLDFETVADLLRQGYTRIPVYESVRNNIVALLHTKDLALVDPDDHTSVKGLCQFYNHPIIFVFEDERLDTLLNEFKKGKSHLACVRSVHSNGEGDPYYEIRGIVTLEDVIEEIIQSEIMDETDTLTDNRGKQRRKGAQVIQNFSDFVKIGGGKSIVSPQLALATFQFLSTSVDPFRKVFISESVLRRLLTQNLFFSLKHRPTSLGAQKLVPQQGSGISADLSRAVVTLYKTGKPADYFLLILEGRVKVTVGKEKLMYEAGPFTFFGVQAISVPLPPGEVSFLSSTPRSHVAANGSTHCPVSSAAPMLQVPIVGSSPSVQQVSGLSLPVGMSPFVPDYSVVAASDVIYMKVHRNIYAAALKATLLERQHRSDTSIEDCFQECRRSDSSPIPSKGCHFSDHSPVVHLPVAGEPLCEPQDGEELCTAHYILTGGSASVSAFNGAC